MRWCVRPRPDQANQPVVFDDRPERKGYRHPSGGAGKLSAIIRSRARGSCHKGRQSRNSEVRLTHRWRKADSNPRSRLYETVCRVVPKGDPERPAGSRIKLRSTRETAIASLRGHAVHCGTEISNLVCSAKESKLCRSISASAQ